MRHRDNATIDLAAFKTAWQAAYATPLTGRFADVALAWTKLDSVKYGRLQTPIHARFVEALFEDLTTPRATN